MHFILAAIQVNAYFSIIFTFDLHCMGTRADGLLAGFD